MSDLHYYHPDWIQKTDEHLTVDVCVYAASSAGVTAACEAKKRGKSVVLLQPGKFVGGLTSGGLGWTDYGKKHVIGGIAREFYRRVGALYGKDEEWHFEPSKAAKVYDDILREAGVSVRFGQYIDKAVVSGGKVTEISLLGGLRVSAKIFIDASYEGDLMSRAGVSYFVGREGNSVYNETLNGVQIPPTHQFSHFVDPYVKEGDPSSGLLPGILAEDMSKQVGKGDKRVQSYNFRVCMTDDPALKIDWEKPPGYDERIYVLAGRWFRAEKDRYNEQVDDHSTTPRKFDIFPNLTPGGFHKTDTNNNGAVSSDFIGMNHVWPEASYEEREKLFQAHVTYQKGYYWYAANDPSVPEKYRNAYRHWGLPKDEFTQTGHWPHQLYVREARRMVADYVITEHNCRGHVEAAEDSIGMGSYNMDSHNCCRFVKMEDGKGRVLNEGDVQVGAVAYPIPYRVIVPKRGEVTNLLVPVCFSASHISYGSARMEPVFMAMGQGAAMAACIAIDDKVAVQDVKYEKLQKQLLEAKQVLTLPK